MKCTSCSISYHEKCWLKTNTQPSKNVNGGSKCLECEIIAQNRDNEMYLIFIIQSLNFINCGNLFNFLYSFFLNREKNSSVTVHNLLQFAMERIVRKVNFDFCTKYNCILTANNFFIMILFYSMKLSMFQVIILKMICL